MEEFNQMNDYIIVKSKDNKLVIRLKKNDKVVYLGSAYSVKRDIDVFMNQFGEIKPYDVIVVFGLATGEHLIALKEALFESNKVLVFEPDRKILSFFENSENGELIAADSRFKIHKFDSEGFGQKLPLGISDYELDRIKFAFYSNYNLLFKEELRSFVEKIKNTINSVNIDKNTTIAHSSRWFNAFLRNMTVMAESTPVDYVENIFKDKPAIIVSAGPSLEKNIHKLKALKDRFVIITGGRTLNALLNEGIEPDFLCVVDPVDNTFTLLKERLDCKAPLVFYEGSNPDVVNQYTGKKIYFTGQYFTNEFLGRNVKTLAYGGSVAHTCMGLAVHLGCDPIVFVGQDFAFTNEKLHANQATHEKEKNAIQNKEEDIFVDDIFGNKVRTNTAYNGFRITMENLIEIFSGKSYINATEGGANIKGTQVMTLDEVDASVQQKEFLKNIDNYLTQDKDINIEKIMDRFSEALSCLMNLEKDCKKAIKLSEELVKHFDKGKRIDLLKINKKLDHIDKGLNKAFEDYAFVNFLLYPTTQYVLGNKEFLVFFEDSKKETGIKIASKSKTLYKGILDVIDKSVPLINQYIFNK